MDESFEVLDSSRKIKRADIVQEIADRVGFKRNPEEIKSSTKLNTQKSNDNNTSR